MIQNQNFCFLNLVGFMYIIHSALTFKVRIQRILRTSKKKQKFKM